jgi:hypothetical protein
MLVVVVVILVVVVVVVVVVVAVNPWFRLHLEQLTVPQLVKKSPTFIAPENSSPCSQQPSIFPYPEPHPYYVYERTVQGTSQNFCLFNTF